MASNDHVTSCFLFVCPLKISPNLHLGSGRFQEAQKRMESRMGGPAMRFGKGVRFAPSCHHVLTRYPQVNRPGGYQSEYETISIFYAHLCHKRF